MVLLPVADVQTSNSPAMNRLRLVGLRRVEECVGRAALDHAAAMQQHDVAGEPSRLAEIVGRHHHLDAARGDGADDVLDRLGGGRIEARGRLVEEQHLRDLWRARAPARAAAARRRTACAPAAAPSPPRPTSASSSPCARVALRARHAGGRQRIADVAGGAAAKHHRTLEHDGAPRRAAHSSRPPQVTRPREGAISPMARRSSVVLPAPFGPISTVGAPGRQASAKSGRGSSRRAAVDAHVFEHDRQIGRAARAWSSREPFAGAPQRPRPRR